MLPGMRVLLTGTTGHLGTNLLSALRRAGHEVVATARREVPGTVRADVLQPDGLLRAGQGCEVTVHAAAVYSDDPGRGTEMVRCAVEGTANVLRAAAANGHRRVLLASSMVTVGFSDRPDTARDERSWNHRPHHPYVRAKIEGEREAWRVAESLGLPLVVLCPGGLVGPGDHGPTPTMAYLAELASGRGLTFAGGVNHVDVRDVADAFVAALDRAPDGARYLLTGDCLPMRELGGLVRALTGRRPRHLPVPRRLLLPIVRRLEPTRHASAVENIGRWPVFSAERAARELAFHPRPPEAALADALRWLARTGRVPVERVQSWEGRLDPTADPTVTPELLHGMS